MVESSSRSWTVLPAVLVLLLYPVAALELCPLAEVGKPYSLHCGGSSKNGLYWEITLPSGELEQKIRCNRESKASSTNENPFITNIFVSCQRTPADVYRSQLLLTSVTTAERDKVFTCTSITDAERASKEVTNCKLRVFHKPEDPECIASKAGDNRIRFQCSTRRVFPGLACRVTQLDVSRNKTVHISKGFKYQTALLINGRDTFLNASCYVELDNLQRGTYQYTGDLSPAWRYDEYISELSDLVSPTRSVSISELPVSVVIKSLDRWPFTLCPGSSELVTLRCGAEGFKSRPIFDWYLNGILQNDSHFVSRRNSNSRGAFGKYPYTSTYKFRPKPQDHGSTILCKAKTTDLEQFDSITFEAQYPPADVPEFKDEFHQSVKMSYNIAEGDTAQLYCLVKGGEPKVISVQVVCYKKEERFVFSASKGYVTSFVLNGTRSLDDAICTCSAGHETKCYYSTSILVIKVMPSESLNAVDDASRPHDEFSLNVTDKADPLANSGDLTPTVYIIVAVAGCMTLTIFLVFMFHCFYEQKRRGMNKKCSTKDAEPDSSSPKNVRPDSSILYGYTEHLYETIASTDELRDKSVKPKTKRRTRICCYSSRTSLEQEHPRPSQDLIMDDDDYLRPAKVSVHPISRDMKSATDLKVTVDGKSNSNGKGCNSDDYITPSSLYGDSESDDNNDYLYDSDRDSYHDLELSAGFEASSTFGSGSTYSCRRVGLGSLETSNSSERDRTDQTYVNDGSTRRVMGAGTHEEKRLRRACEDRGNSRCGGEDGEEKRLGRANFSLLE